MPTNQILLHLGHCACRRSKRRQARYLQAVEGLQAPVGEVVEVSARSPCDKEGKAAKRLADVLVALAMDDTDWRIGERNYFQKPLLL